MAYASTTLIGSVLRENRTGSFLTIVKTAIARRRVYIRTLEELNKLTDRELADLGIPRMTIADVAKEAAYGR